MKNRCHNIRKVEKVDPLWQEVFSTSLSHFLFCTSLHSLEASEGELLGSICHLLAIMGSPEERWTSLGFSVPSLTHETGFPTRERTQQLVPLFFSIITSVAKVR